MRSLSRRPLTAALFALLGAACVGGAPPSIDSQPAPSPQVAPLSARRANPADVQFISGMIHHHAQALVMAELARTHGASPAVRTLSERIHVSQTDEIRLMQQWLADMGEPVPEPSPTGMRMMMGGVEHDMLMPGMLSKEQLAQLARARGAEFDRLFLTYMIQHHGGAVVMVDDLFGTDGAAQDPATFKLASDIQVDQRTEIARMERMLKALVGSDQEP